MAVSAEGQPGIGPIDVDKLGASTGESGARGWDDYVRPPRRRSRGVPGAAAAFLVLTLIIHFVIVPLQHREDTPHPGRDQVVGTVTAIFDAKFAIPIAGSPSVPVSYPYKAKYRVGGHQRAYTLSGSSPQGVAPGESVIVQYAPTNPSVAHAVRVISPFGSILDGLVLFVFLPATAILFFLAYVYRDR